MFTCYHILWFWGNYPLTNDIRKIYSTLKITVHSFSYIYFLCDSQGHLEKTNILSLSPKLSETGLTDWYFGNFEPLLL